MAHAPGNPPDAPWMTYMDAVRALESGQLPGHQPLKQWEDPTKLNIEVNAYGWQGQHALVRLHLPKEDDFENARLAALFMIFDFKHTKPWLCEFCGEPSRETHMQFVPYVTLDVCRMPVFIHHICDMDKASCRAAMRTVHDRLNSQHGWLMGPHAPPLSKPPDEIYPLGASCATCKTDESARVDMKRCSACKMTRYCRHIKLVQFEGFSA
ncbi:hypothetical protein GSI_14385 [Ganoderma sinense ZZ0214-1]|uniref:MYND-type domain-containing protein n=1 Tax=Ganoderma sinense ZZ0214-1 TaxID=1077348 RepID=A0A2G8RNJ4_9APHY|nr:hypothetical protein GSI_14385 [Ganoderma sinense ZZ0214-1]